MSSKSPISSAGSGSSKPTSEPQVRISWSILAGRRVEFIPSPPSSHAGDDLSITVACKLYSFGIHSLLEGFWAKESAYVPVVVKLEGKEDVTTVYVKVDSAAKRLLSSREEVRKQIGQNPYWSGRVSLIKSSIETIQASTNGARGKQGIYDELVTVYARGLKAIDSGNMPEGGAESYGEYTVSRKEDKIVIKRELGELGKGSFGTVAKVFYVASGEFAALKKIFEGKGKSANPVAQAIMEKQKRTPNEETHLLKVDAIITREGFFDEEYELATGNIEKELPGYEEKQLKDLGISTIQALEELEEIGYPHLDIKPPNLLNVGSKENPQFRLGDYDEGSPHIATEDTFKWWVKQNSGVTRTPNYNIEVDFDDLKALEKLALCVQDNRALPACNALLEKVYPSNCPMRTFLLEIQELVKNGDSGSPDKAFTKVFTAYKQKAREISVFQLGVMLYEGVVGERPYLPAKDEYCQATPKEFTEMQEKLAGAKKGSTKFKALIASMLNPDSTQRPTYQDIKSGMQEEPSPSLEVGVSQRQPGLSTIFEEEVKGSSSDSLSEIYLAPGSKGTSRSPDSVEGFFGRASPDPSGSPILSGLEEDLSLVTRVQKDMAQLASGQELKELLEKTDRVFQAAKKNTLGPSQTMIVNNEEGFIQRVKSGKVQVSVILGTLGKGGFGYVYKCYDLFTGSMRALKILDRDSDEPQVAEEVIAYEIQNGPIPYVQRFLEAPHTITNFVGGEEKVEWIVSEAYECDAYTKIKERKTRPAALSTLLREFYCIAAGFNNVFRVLGRIHLDLKPDNFLSVRDGEMVVGDLGDLPKVRNVEEWVSSIRLGSLHHIHTRDYNARSGIDKLSGIQSRVETVINRNVDVIREIKSLQDEITLTEEETLALDRGVILESVKEKVKKYYQDEYDRGKEVLSKPRDVDNQGLYSVIQEVKDAIGLTEEEKRGLSPGSISENIKNKFFDYRLQGLYEAFANGIAPFMREDLKAIEEIRKLGDAITLTEEEIAFLDRGILPESVERKFEEHMFNEYKKCAQKVAVFQLGSVFYEMLFEGNLPYSVVNEYQVPTQGEFEVIARKLEERMPDNRELAVLIADMLSPEIDVDPSKARERPSPEVIEAALKNYLAKEGIKL